MKFIFALAALAVLVVFAPAPVRAGDDSATTRPGVTIGGRAFYSRPKGADRGSLGGGAQVRFHITSVLALEGSADYRQEKFGGVATDIMPLQASLMIYLMPKSRLTPYILGGGGWYYTHVRRPVNTTSYRFGPHAGAGLQFYLNQSWSIDGSYRYLWTEDIHSQDPNHPVGRNFSDKGYMLTAGLNYRL